jgi:mutator protein MutT
MPPPVEVAAGLIFRDGKLLIAQRPVGAHLGGLWEFPGGKREPGETFEACLRRELREELDTEVEVGPLLEELIHHYQDRPVHLRFYRCRWLCDEPRPIHCQALAWITAPEINQYEFPAADSHLLARLRSEWSQLSKGKGVSP